MLNVERVRLFTAALRSGEYEQGEGYLNRGGKFCCLGVATEVAMANGCPVEALLDLSTVAYRDKGRPRGYATETILPDSVVEWYGFESDNPVFRRVGSAVSAAAANDRLGWSFAQIADAFDALADAAEREQEEE